MNIFSARELGKTPRQITHVSIRFVYHFIEGMVGGGGGGGGGVMSLRFDSSHLSVKIIIALIRQESNPGHMG